MIRPLFLIVALVTGSAADAGDGRAGGRMLLTDGVTAIEGSAGGGIATWATIAGAETRNGIGGTIHGTAVLTPDFTLRSYGAAAGLFDRLELSYAHQDLDTDAAGAALGLGRGYRISQDVFGAKLRLSGNLVYDQTGWLPQLSVGVQRKRADRAYLVRTLGAKSGSGTDYYVAATRLILDRGVLLNATLRMTRANQGGLLGFGGDRRSGYRAQGEGSIGLLLSPRFVVGAEYRTRPDNLGFAREQDAVDAFAAWALHRRLTLAAAYVDLGDIATARKQRGLFLSLQGAF